MATGIIDNFEFKNNDAFCQNKVCKDEDTWTFKVDNILIFDSDRSSYQDPTKKYRWLLQGTITSSLFGIFTPHSKDLWDNWLILKDLEADGQCGQWQHTYSISGSIISPLFWVLNVINEKSRFCPNSLETFIVFSSPLLPKKILYNLGLDEDEEEDIEQNVGDSSFTITFSGTTTTNVFEKQQVAILGITSADWDIDTLLNESGNKGINEINSSKWILPVFGNEINNRVSKLTRNAPDDTKQVVDMSIESFDSDKAMVTIWDEKIFYFNYEGREDPSTSLLNKWFTVTLWKPAQTFDGNNRENFQTQVEGKNTLIVKWANVYIKSDIYNKDKNSLLTIVAQRDSKNNGGNIYIDPDVTNIDGVLIADGSLLSYRNKKILNRNTDNDSGLLARQLYIYGMLFTKNTIGSNKVPYGSDHSIFGNKDAFSSKKENPYDLANIRGFQARYAASWALKDCGGGIANQYWTAGYIDTGAWEQKLKKIKEYAWAGKMKCFNGKINTNLSPEALPFAKPADHLRTIDKQNALIIQHNPSIQSLSPYVLSK